MGEWLGFEIAGHVFPFDVPIRVDAPAGHVVRVRVPKLPRDAGARHLAQARQLIEWTVGRAP